MTKNTEQKPRPIELFSIWTALIFLTSNALATNTSATHHVPDQFSTIQSAIDTAKNGDVIIIDPGIYEPIELMEKSLFIRASEVAGQVVIDGMKSSRCVDAIGSESLHMENIVIRNGFTFSAQHSGGAGIDAVDMTLVLEGVTFESCLSVRNGSGYFEAEGGAIRMNGGTLQMDMCLFMENEARCHNTGNLYSWGWARGGAVHLNDVSAVLTRCAFEGNTTDSVSVGNSWHNVYSTGGGMRANNSSVLIDSCTFTENSTRIDSQSSSVAAVISSGAGISGEGGAFVIVNTTFDRNELRSTSATTYYDNPASGGALSLGGVQELVIENCVFTGNLLAGGLARQGTMRGAAISAGFSGSHPRTIRRCVFTDNVIGVNGSSGPRLGGALCTEPTDSSLDAQLIIEECLFMDNEGTSGSTIRFGSGGNTMKHSTVCGGQQAQIMGTWTDGGSVEIIDTCTTCPQDLNGDGAIDGFDLATVMAWWRTNGATYPSPDLDRNGVVDGKDLNAILTMWGTRCP